MDTNTLQILIVDDDPEHIELILRAFESQGSQARFVTAKSLAEAKDSLRTLTPDLAIVDLYLPDGKGTELLMFEGSPPDWPVLILTGQGDERVAVESLKMGAFDYLGKSEATILSLPHIADISINKWRSLAELHQAEKLAGQFGRILDQSANEIYLFETETLHYVHVNSGACTNLGYSSEELKSMTPLDLKLAFTPEIFAQKISPLLSGEKQNIVFETQHYRKDGTFYPVQINLQLTQFGNRQVFLAMAMDLTEKRKTQDALYLSEERFRNAFDTAAHGISLVGLDGVFLEVNRAICDILGYSEHELLGSNIANLTHPDDRLQSKECLDKMLNDLERSCRLENRYLHKKGHTIWALQSTTLVRDSSGTPLYIVSQMQDITEAKAAFEKLLDINREMEFFAYTLSHDLRTPLAPIIGYAELLQNKLADSLDAESLDCLGEIQSQGLRMLSLIEDMLHLAQAGHLPAPEEPVDFDALAEEVLMEVASEFTLPQEALRLPPSGVRLRIHPTLLHQILTNLVGNAARYAGTENGPIEIGTHRTGAATQIYVRDHGPGVPEEEREHIFEMFKRGTTGKKTFGTGIGLATVRKIARRFNGKAWVEETPGGGATFRVDLVEPE